MEPTNETTQKENVIVIMKYIERLFRLLFNMVLVVAIFGAIGYFAFSYISANVDKYQSEYNFILQYKQYFVYVLAVLACLGSSESISPYRPVTVREAMKQQVDSVKRVGHTYKKALPHFIMGIIKFPFALIKGIIGTVLVGPAGGFLAVKDAAEMTKDMATGGAIILKDGMEEISKSKIKIGAFLLVPFFLVYYIVMVFPELIMGRIPAKVVFGLDKAVTVIGILSWIVGIVCGILYFVL